VQRAVFQLYSGPEQIY